MNWNCEILRGLPAIGDPPIIFSSGRNAHAEGYVIQFNEQAVKSKWVVNFIPNNFELFGVTQFIDSKVFAVIAGGDLYLVDAEKRELITEVISGVLRYKKLKTSMDIILLNTGGIVTCLTPEGPKWKTTEFVSEDILDLQEAEDHLIGKAWDGYSTEGMQKIKIDLSSGAVALIE